MPQVAPRPAPALVLPPNDGERRDETPGSQTAERKGKEAHRSLAWKRRE